MSAEIVGGIWSGSLAILTDAAHLLSDLTGMIISIMALTVGTRSPTNSFTYGYQRSETVGALTSIILIWGLTIWLIFVAVKRLWNPTEVNGFVMLIFASTSLVANLFMSWRLRNSKTQGHGDGGHDDEQENCSLGPSCRIGGFGTNNRNII